MGFAEVLRTATWTDHESAEDDSYLKNLMAGRLSPEAYGEMVAQHYFAYVALDGASRRLADDPVAGAFVFPELYREEALVRDLEGDLRRRLGRADRPQQADPDARRPDQPGRRLAGRICGPPLHSLPRRPVRRTVHPDGTAEDLRLRQGGGVDFYHFDIGSLPASRTNTAAASTCSARASTRPAASG